MFASPSTLRFAKNASPPGLSRSAASMWWPSPSSTAIPDPDMRFVRRLITRSAPPLTSLSAMATTEARGISSGTRRGGAQGAKGAQVQERPQVPPGSPAALPLCPKPPLPPCCRPPRLLRDPRGEEGSPLQPRPGPPPRDHLQDGPQPSLPPGARPGLQKGSPPAPAAHPGGVLEAPRVVCTLCNCAS